MVRWNYLLSYFVFSLAGCLFAGKAGLRPLIGST